MNITKLATITASLPAYEARGEGLANLTDTTDRKCLFFLLNGAKGVTLDILFADPYDIEDIVGRSANDAELRDPKIVRLVRYDDVTGNPSIVFEDTAAKWLSRHADNAWDLRALDVAPAKHWQLYLEPSGHVENHAFGSSAILQLAELGLFGMIGTAPPTDPTPPPTDPTPPPLTTLPTEVDAALMTFAEFLASEIETAAQMDQAMLLVHDLNQFLREEPIAKGIVTLVNAQLDAAQSELLRTKIKAILQYTE